MNIAITDIEVNRAYRLLTNLVVPRPIAWVTSQNALGVINLAPFSFFNMIGSNPPVIVIGVGDEGFGQPKHTAKNISTAGEFVVNLVTDELVHAMNITAADFPSGQSELHAAGLHTAPSTRIAVPRVAEAKASLECKLHSLQRIGDSNVIIGEIVSIYVADDIIDQRLHVHNFAALGRMGTPSSYCRTEDSFQLPRMSYDDWRALQPTK